MLDIPLYRGDRDPNLKRKLRTTAPHGYLMTNLNSGGEGRTISEKPLIELIDKHINIGWNTTHFLSFSEDKNTAFRFGLNCPILTEANKQQQNYIDVSYDDNWEFVISTIDPNKMSIERLKHGIFVGKYQTNNPKYKEILPVSKVLLINVTKFLADFANYEQSKTNSARDKEWLILPANPMEFVNGTEYSSILEGGCISEITFYSKY